MLLQFQYLLEKKKMRKNQIINQIKKRTIKKIKKKKKKIKKQIKLKSLEILNKYKNIQKY